MKNIDERVLDELKSAKILGRHHGDIRESLERWSALPIDFEMPASGDHETSSCQTTIAGEFSIAERGTYSKHNTSTLHFAPCEAEGWWLDRRDQPEQLPIRVSVRNVWTTVRNIVLRSGAPHNYLRMVEHVIALRLGMGLDNVIVQIDSGDPPLFTHGSLELVEKVRETGIIELPERPLVYWTVTEPVIVGGPSGSFLAVLPPEGAERNLWIDCGIDFPNAIGKQRIQFDLTDESFLHGAQARTNCTRAQMLYVRTIGKLFADTRNLGYTNENIVIAGKNSYVNKPKMVRSGKSLEAVWHRSMLDLLAALSLIETGRLAGRVVSYKAGHALDVRLVTQLYLNDVLRKIL